MTQRVHDTNEDEPSVFTGPDLPIRLVMASQVARIGPTATLREVATKLAAVEIGALVVGGLDTILGVISERDIVRAIAGRADLNTTTAREVIGDGQSVSCGPNATTSEVAELMAKHGLRHVLVTDGDHLAGIVSARALVAAFGR